MAEAPKQRASSPPDEVSELRRELAVEKSHRQAVDTENARLQAQIESYAEDLNSLYQERHGRGRGGLSAELSSTRAELADEAARRQLLGDLYKKSTDEARTLGDQLVTYGQELAQAYKAGKKSVAARPVSRLERARAALLLLGMLGTVGAGLVFNPPAASPDQLPTAAAVTAAAAPGEVRVVTSGGEPPNLDSAMAAAAAAAAAATASSQGADESALTATAVARQIGAAGASATVLAGRAASSLATAAAAGTSAANAARTATAAAGSAPGGPTERLAGVAAANATATAATGAARTAVSEAAAAQATATVALEGAATALAVASHRVGSDGAETATAMARSMPPAAAANTPTTTPSVVPGPGTAGADLRPTVTALAGSVAQAAADATVRASTATVFARQASAVAVTATAFALTATAPTTTPTADALGGPPRQLGHLERCSWEVPLPRIGPGRGYYVEFDQLSRATITALWTHSEGTMALASRPLGSQEEWQQIAQIERGDVVAESLPPATYRVRVQNLAEELSQASVVALFYDDMALCVEPRIYPGPLAATATGETLASGVGLAAVARTPFLDCRPYVRAPHGFVQVQPRLLIDRPKRTEGTMPVTLKITGPDTDLTFSLVAAPGRRAERIPLTRMGRYQLQAIAEGADLHENCNQSFWFERTNPALPTLPAPPD